MKKRHKLLLGWKWKGIEVHKDSSGTITTTSLNGNIVYLDNRIPVGKYDMTLSPRRRK